MAASSPWPQAEGKRAGEGGSHSPVHCRLTPTNSQSLLHPSPDLVPQRHKVRLNSGRGDPPPTRNQQSALAMPLPWVAG